MRLTFEAMEEALPGARWQSAFRQRWPSYRRWFEAQGPRRQPSLAVCRRRLGQYMPEMLPLFDRLLELAGGDETAGRFLSAYRPPRYLAGCSQAVWQRDGDSQLVRNYDLDPRLSDGLMLHSAWNGRQVMATSEFLWGVADGMNEAGLSVSLAFGGRDVIGNGFGMPVILRYVLETCDRIREAGEVLKRVPSHMAYNVTLLDRNGRHATVQVAPDRRTRMTDEPLATNHQGAIEWAEHAQFSRTLQRERQLRQQLRNRQLDAAGFVQGFLEKPLYSDRYDQGFGTLYTVAYRPETGSADWHWPDAVWQQSFTRFDAGVHSFDTLDDETRVRSSDVGAARPGKAHPPAPAVPAPAVNDDLIPGTVSVARKSAASGRSPERRTPTSFLH